MVRVFFERSGYAELVAVFMDEYTYNDCVPALERLCKDMGYNKMTESIDISLKSQLLMSQIKEL
jgi:hypothetical protein